MASFRSFDVQQPLCPFHGAHEDMTNVCEENQELLASWNDKLFETPYAIERLSLSLHNSQYDGLSEGMGTFLKFLYDNVPQINVEGFTQQAFKHVTIIRHRVPSNECKMMMLGCKNCNQMTDPLYFASNHLDCQQVALNVLQDFFRPYCPEVQCSGSGNKVREVLCRRDYWQRYWSLRQQSQIPPAVNSSTGSTAACSTPPSQAGSEATPTEGSRFMDWEPVPMQEPPYKCIHNLCRYQRTVIEPGQPGPSSPSIGNSLYSYSTAHKTAEHRALRLFVALRRFPSIRTRVVSRCRTIRQRRRHAGSRKPTCPRAPGGMSPPALPYAVSLAAPSAAARACLGRRCLGRPNDCGGA